MPFELLRKLGEISVLFQCLIRALRNAEWFDCIAPKHDIKYISLCPII